MPLAFAISLRRRRDVTNTTWEFEERDFDSLCRPEWCWRCQEAGKMWKSFARRPRSLCSAGVARGTFSSPFYSSRWCWPSFLLSPFLSLSLRPKWWVVPLVCRQAAVAFWDERQTTALRAFLRLIGFVAPTRVDFYAKAAQLWIPPLWKSTVKCEKRVREGKSRKERTMTRFSISVAGACQKFFPFNAPAPTHLKWGVFI